MKTTTGMLIIIFLFAFEPAFSYSRGKSASAADSRSFEKKSREPSLPQPGSGYSKRQTLKPLPSVSGPLKGKPVRLPPITGGASLAKPQSQTFSLSGRPIYPKGKQNNIAFAKALPEDISNENFPDRIENFDYPNATLLELAEAIGKLTGLNFIIDPGLGSKRIKIIAPSQITVAEAYKAFLTALAANQYTLVKKGAFWKITPTASALKDNIEIYSGDYFPNTDQLITRIIKLKYINAKTFADSIKYLLSQEKAISSFEETNSVIISDYGSVIENITKLAEQMDLPGSEEQVRIIPVQHADAGDLSEILNKLIFNKGKQTKSGVSFGSKRRGSRLPPVLSQSKKKEGNIKISTILPDDRTNSLIVSVNGEGFKKVVSLVKKLDTYVDPARNGGIYVYNVLYGTADQIYNTLTGLGSKSGPTKAPAPKSGSRTYRRPFSSSSGKSSTSPLFENVTIMPDSHTNSLIISARNRYDFERIKAVLKKIDVPKDQVFVQALIVEMAVDKGDHWEVNLVQALTSTMQKKLGIDEDLFPGVPLAGFLNQPLGVQSLTDGLKFGPGLLLGLPLSGVFKKLDIDTVEDSQQRSRTLKLIESGVNEKGQELNETQLNALTRSLDSKSSERDIYRNLRYSMFPLIQILKKAGNFNILSTPQLTALDNVTASIEVGENAPVGLTSTTGTAGVAVRNSVERQDVTMKLEITPSINVDSGTVQMKIVQTFDDFSARQSTASALRERGVHVLKRNIDTTLVLNDRETAVLGGLIVEKESKDENKVPILGDIPLLGWLFKGSTSERQRSNLLVFITPTIIKGKSQKQDMRTLLGKKLEERIHFVKKHMKGRDPHGEFLKTMQEEKPMESLLEPEDKDSMDVLIPPYPEETLGKEEMLLPEDSSSLPQSTDEGEGEEVLPPESFPESSSPDSSLETDTQGESSSSDSSSDIKTFESLSEDEEDMEDIEEEMLPAESLLGEDEISESPEKQEEVEDTDADSEDENLFPSANLPDIGTSSSPSLSEESKSEQEEDEEEDKDQEDIEDDNEESPPHFKNIEELDPMFLKK